MPYICLSCGNKDSFEGTESGRCYFTQSASFNGEGETEENGDTDYDDFDTTETNIETCGECNSTNIKYFETNILNSCVYVFFCSYGTSHVSLVLLAHTLK